MPNLSNKILTILVFDEDVKSTKEIISWLRLIGHKVQSCDTYDNFLDQITANQYDIVLFDFNDSKPSELDSLHAVKFYRFTVAIKSEFSPKFILYTNRVSPSQHEIYLEDISNARIDGILSKGSNLEQFLSQFISILNLPVSLAREWNRIAVKQVEFVSNVVKLHPDYGSD